MVQRPPPVLRPWTPQCPLVSSSSTLLQPLTPSTTPPWILTGIFSPHHQHSSTCTNLLHLPHHPSVKVSPRGGCLVPSSSSSTCPPVAMTSNSTSAPSPSQLSRQILVAVCESDISANALRVRNTAATNDAVTTAANQNTAGPNKHF